MAKAPTEDGRNIADTLSDLNIDPDAPPEIAAQVAADAAGAVVEPVADNGKAAADAVAAAGANGAAPQVSTDVTIEIPPPAEEPPPETEPIPEPTPALVPPPKQPKAIPKGSAGVAGKLGKGLADKVGTSEVIKVYKREENGETWYINEHNKRDLEAFTDMEAFLHRYYLKDHGSGEYHLRGVDALGREVPLSPVRMKGVPAQTTDNSMVSLVQALMQKNSDTEKQFFERMEAMRNTQPQQQSPLDLLQGVMTLQDQVTGKSEEANKAAAAEASTGVSAAMQALSSAGDKSMQMMMAMMQQSRDDAARQNQLMMTLISKPKEEDPVMKLLLMKLMEDNTGGGGALPPPPPPPDPSAGLATMLTAMGSFMAAMGGGGGGGGEEDDFKQFLQQMLLKQQSDGMSAKEVIQLVVAKSDKPGTDDFRSAVDNMAAIMNIANNVNRQGEGGPAAGFFDALGALFSNRDFAGSIAQTIRAKMDQSGSIQQRNLAVERQRAEMAGRIAARDAAIAAGQPPPPQVGAPAPQTRSPFAPGGPPNQGATPAAPPPQQQPQVVAAPPPGAQVVAAPPPGAHVATPAQVQQSAANVQAAVNKLPQLPAETHDHINGLMTAKDEGELVGRTVSMFVYFAEFEDWRPFMEKLLHHIRSGNKPGTLEYVASFFEGLAAINLIDPTLGRVTVAAVDKHFEVVTAQLAPFPLDGDEEITGADLLDPPDPTAPDAQPTGDDGDPTGGDAEPPEDDGDPEPSA